MHKAFPLLSSTFINSILQQLLPLWEERHSQSSSESIPSSNNDDNNTKPCMEQLPPIWPSSQVIVQRRVPHENSNVGPATTVTYYDAKQGGNLIIVTPDDATLPVKWDLELNSGHSFYFEPSTQTCRKVDFPVGILRQDWLVADAQPLGEFTSWDGSGEAVCGWTKLDFIDYYANKETGIPTSWYFHNMKAEFRVLHFDQNVTIDPSLFDPPSYCL